MGPRPFSRGNLYLWHTCQRMRYCFNGATTFQPWKRLWPTLNEQRKPLLQWGHDLSAVETSRSEGMLPFVNSASMGPRPFSRGNVYRRHRARAAVVASMGPRPFSRGNMKAGLPIMRGRLLQWGHDLSAVETSPSSGRERWRSGFNGATTFQPWKHTSPRWRQGAAPCFNGATTFQPWKPMASTGRGPEENGFNGATTFQPWKLARHH